jgi:hypothetical protein
MPRSFITSFNHSLQSRPAKMQAIKRHAEDINDPNSPSSLIHVHLTASCNDFNAQLQLFKYSCNGDNTSFATYLTRQIDIENFAGQLQLQLE